MTSYSSNKTHAIYAGIADAVLILLFAALGRSAHEHSETFFGIVATAWPFLLGAVLAWVVLGIWKKPLRIWSNGVFLVVITVAVGMVLRVLTGAGTAVAFIIVALVSLAVFLLGHRAIALLILRLRGRSNR
ncbi:DUF3054 domain-containing protein [Pseudarthrobacter sp. J1763]|uniref:DUF3054 domain-containing protein n=1 Tax=Pseudarthrobacter sp. J1763 TaxID=3420445 RepID=UPI003D265D90